MSDLKHIGMPRRSGRYPWGSGNNAEQRGTSFLGTVRNLKKQGQTEAQIAEGMGIKTTQLRRRITISKAEQRQEDYAMANRLKAKGYSNVEIGKMMGGKNESSVRSLLNPALQERSEIVSNTAKILRDSVAKNKYVDVGLGNENHLGVSRTKLQTSIEMLREEGYKIHYVKLPQMGTDKFTSLMVLTDAKTPPKEVYDNLDKIKMVMDFHADAGDRTDLGLHPVKNVKSSTIHVKYKEDGGEDKDGVIELRRGVPDLDLGNAKYAQVRIAVDGTHYLKGMAMYSDKMPDGANIIYNTNKKRGTPIMSDDDKETQVFKPMEKDKNHVIDKDNPFGAELKKGGQRGALNIINEEGDWEKWNKALSSQMLSKQNPPLIKRQLDLTLANKKAEMEEIMSLNNPAIKKTLLDSFADDCDGAAVHLKAAAMPRQGSHVILPFPNMKPDQIYAPNYNDGEEVVLIRYPHGGTFEIPQLTVNNRITSVKNVIGRATDAVGIHPKVAEQLSGADFDGDTVLVIPTSGRTIKTSSPLKELQNFSPKASYPKFEGMPEMTKKQKGLEMGKISNLITDMTIRGATPEEIARAVKHSMVVIDAEKHKLNYKKSYIDNGIGALKKKYQGGEKNGASTLISKASSEKRVPQRTGYFDVDPVTGKKIYKLTGETYTKVTYDKKGNKKLTVLPKTTKSTKMAEEQDAFKLSSGTKVESIYAEYANELKAMANESRKVSYHTGNIIYSPTANKTYEREVSSLKAQLNIALKNAPIERQAQLYANKVVASKKDANPEMDHDELKKIKGQAIAEGRLRTGASKTRIDIKPKEWEAIQAGAVSNNVLEQILRNTDVDKVKKLATPKEGPVLSSAKLDKARAMKNSGHTQAEIAAALGVSTTTLSKALK